METTDTTPSTPSDMRVSLSFQGQTLVLEGSPQKRITAEMTGEELYQQTLEALQLSDETSLKVLCKGKRIECNTEVIPAFVKAAAAATNSSSSNKPLKLLVMATSTVVLADLSSKRSDPTIRGFDQESPTPKAAAVYQPWGPNLSHQDFNHKFCRFQACTWQSFGHRPTDGTTPHAFRAMQLLEKLAMDPGVVAVMQERELVVGTLGEMDPIDDRVMHKMQHEAKGSCLLGYNTNGGTRIDLKLRTDDLTGFRPYPQLVATLLHELSHNWVGEHNALFWTNFAQMRAEYLTRHKALQSTVVEGTTTAERAGLNDPKHPFLQDIPATIFQELVPDMAQHGLHPAMIEAPIRQRCHELQEEFLRGTVLGGGTSNMVASSSLSARERALAAAEQRRNQHEQDSKKQGENNGQS
jgi:hypothetical protein